MKGIFLTAAVVGLIALSWTPTAEAADAAKGRKMSAATAPSTYAFMEARARVYNDMKIDYSGDPDVDYARTMISHLESAIALAGIATDQGEDPDLRALSEELIASRAAEIAVFRAWLAHHGS